jgi:hypothetical protein
MTANELAVYLEDITDWEESPYRQAATMLRQQAQEIEELKEQVKFLKDKNIMVDNSEVEYGFQYLYGEDMLEANKKITNMLRKMVDEKFEKELKKASERA